MSELIHQELASFWVSTVVVAALWTSPFGGFLTTLYVYISFKN